MSYRDEHEALRARLDATEQRLRIAEEELADAKRRVDAHVEKRSAPARWRRIGSPSAPGARRQWPFSSELDTFAYGRHWEFITAGLSLIVSATLFRLGTISGTLAVALFVLSLAGIGLLSRWIRSTPRPLVRALEDLENDPASIADLTTQARTRVGVDPAVLGNDPDEKDVSSDTLKKRDDVPSVRRSRQSEK
jgi:hypothetical protein